MNYNNDLEAYHGRFVRGQTVRRVPCPPRCGCDADQVPIGTKGQVLELPEPTTYTPGMRNGQYLVFWSKIKGIPDGRRWYTYEHAMEQWGPEIPDIDYLA